MSNTQFVSVDRKGQFRGQILDYGLQKVDSGAVGVRLHVRLDAFWNGEAWDDWSGANVDAWGTLWIVKKDGTVNNNSVDSLVKYAGWDGSLKSIVENTWEPTPCQVSISEEEYKGEMQYRIAYVNDLERTPGANVGNVTSDDLKALEARFGASLRAVAGNAKRNTAPPATAKPAAPPRPAQKLETVPPSPPDEDIAF